MESVPWRERSCSMKILQCHIENFGTWSDKTFDFSAGCNSFCEENGWGKSTLAAFIRIMFYGFANERKRDELENERKKYMPWQGGVYGGQMSFEVDGVAYVVSRIFGKKEKDDKFELRYLETNKKSNDFSTNLGEELFHIDQETFLRTVFISQNDCETKMTDGMSAKIGNLELQSGDMSSFEQANERLTDALNKMSPTRKTGSLYKMSERIGELSMRVRQRDFVEQSIDQLFEKRKEEQEKLKSLEDKKTKWLEQQKQRSDQNELLLKKREYEGICKNYQQRMEQYQKVRNYFPAVLPRGSELERYVKDSSRLLEEQRSAQIYQLSEQEQELLQSLEEKNWNEKEVPVGNKKKVGLIVGLSLLVLGVVLYVVKFDAGLFLMLAGAFVAGVSLLTQGKGASKKSQEELKKLEQERYQQLQEKENRYESAYQSYRALHNEISFYVKSLGFMPLENLQEQMQELKEHFLECKNAYQEYQSAKVQKETFEEQYESLELMLQEKKEPEETNIQPLLDEIELCKTEVSKIDTQLEQLLEQKDVIVESEQELEKQQELYRETKKKYEDLKKVQVYLQNARDAFSAKYAGPIKTGFDKYYQLLTGQEASAYKLDVNANLTATVYGMQRDSRLLSCGLRDLTGLCMRMAFVDAMYQAEKPFLILDDPFVNLDAEKTEKGLKLLEKIGEEYQILYFTCHESRTFKNEY